MDELLVKAAKANIHFDVVGDELHISAPKGALTDELRQAIRRNKAHLLALLRERASAPEPVTPVQPAPANRWQPFPLTDLQHAYWLGRDSTLEMGGVATHLYVELACPRLDMARLNTALAQMIQRHDMLRAVVSDDGKQCILERVPDYRIALDDQSQATAQAAERAVTATRDALSHQVLSPDRWPLFDIRVTHLPDGGSHLHVSLDLLILDAWSIFLFFRQWHRLYETPGHRQSPLELSFRDYVLAERAEHGGEAYRRSLAYWMDRVDALPEAPQLPLRADPDARRAPRFHRREARIPRDRWTALRERARREGLTPSVLLLAAYSEVLARWSLSPHFTVNVTVSNRRPLHPQVDELLGDFTSPILQAVDRGDPTRSFLDFALGLQRHFAANLEHREVSGVVVLREWAKRRGLVRQAAMPVVFSSGLVWTGDTEVGDLEQFGRKVHSISQTSQVWLDHHVMELGGDLAFMWDAAEAVFEPGVLDAMFEAYRDLLERLIDDPRVWQRADVVQLPRAMAERRARVNRTAAILPARGLHAAFVEQALQDPDAPALLGAGRTVSYGQLLGESAAVANTLLANGLSPGEPVAVMMHKGWEQVVAVFGVLLAGGAYLPVDAGLPARRREALLALGEVRQVLVQAGDMADEAAAAGYRPLAVLPGVTADLETRHRHTLAGDLGRLAYVIFTSGTTGVPKGVMIDHRGAANTVEHINRLLAVGAHDRVLAVSSLSFDLSVYDIFGVLGAGGALVLPDAGKGHDPVHWRALMSEHRVSLWNSAPQLMSMLMSSFAPGDRDVAPLRHVLLSGDFIPLDLPDRVHHRYPGARFISLGGATEASIWSIYHPVAAVDPAWRSIPYGKPLPNQTIRVCDEALRDRPDQVRGRLFIGGAGLAMGYWRDEEKTAARFVTDPATGERLYDTGDLGHYDADGNVRILGRDDGQIKIRGHRVELGEIETVLRQHPGIDQAVVVAGRGVGDTRHLVAYVAPAADAAAADYWHADAPALKAYVAECLPDYMVPRHVVLMRRLPVSANGKIDYRALPPVAEEAAPAVEGPRNAVEQTILQAWSGVIAGGQIGVTDNFFELGGDSVLATELVRDLNAVLPGFELQMHELFENLTVASLAALYQGRVGGRAPAEAAQTPSVDEAAMLADVAQLCEQVSALAMDTAQPARPLSDARLLLLTGATGWVGAHVLQALLAQTRVRVCCLVRAPGEAAGRERLREALAGYGIRPEAGWARRVDVVCGDLTEPELGLAAEQRQGLAHAVDGIIHLAASVNVLAAYGAHRRVNVLPLAGLLELAVTHRLKPLLTLSPMTVCKRHRADGSVVLHREVPVDDAQGLVTGYAQSKWAAEQTLLAAGRRGLPVTVYRTTHALPCTGSGRMKPNDTYGTVLRVLAAVGAVPEWDTSAFNGVPVDTLAALLVDDALAADGGRGVVHIDNRTAPSFRALATWLAAGEAWPSLPLATWKTHCLDTAARLGGEAAALARVLFADRPQGAAVEHMFVAHPIDTGHLERRGKGGQLTALTPPDYWRTVVQHLR